MKLRGAFLPKQPLNFPPAAPRTPTLDTANWKSLIAPPCFLLPCCILKGALKERRGLGMLTVGVVLLPDSVHDPVGLDPQEEAAVFTVQPFGLLEAPGRKPAAAAVFRCGWKCCDSSRGHRLLLFPLLAGKCFFCSSRAGAPSEASHLPLFTSSPPPPGS